MEHATEYASPGKNDYDNVLALNTAFLDLATDLKGPQKGRLAVAPFLLFSLRENDLSWWSDVLSVGSQLDLMEPPAMASDDIRALQSASIGFLWQLSRRNPYAARIITGANLAWCELLAEQPLITLLERSAARGDLMTSRLGDDYDASSQFLAGGASSRHNVRRSSHIVALQSMLTTSRHDPELRLSAAACRLSIPNVRITATALRRVSDKKV